MTTLFHADGYDTPQLMEALLSSISKDAESSDLQEEDTAAKIASKKVLSKVRNLLQARYSDHSSMRQPPLILKSLEE